MKNFRSDIQMWEEKIISVRGKIKAYRYSIFLGHTFTMRKQFKRLKAKYVGCTPLPPVHNKNGLYL